MLVSEPEARFGPTEVRLLLGWNGRRGEIAIRQWVVAAENNGLVYGEELLDFGAVTARIQRERTQRSQGRSPR